MCALWYYQGTGRGETTLLRKTGFQKNVFLVLSLCFNYIYLLILRQGLTYPGRTQIPYVAEDNTPVSAF